MNRINICLALLGLTILTFSCGGPQTVWTGSHNFAAGKWTGERRITFTPDTFSLERAGAVKGIITFRYGANASVKAFPLIVETESPATGYYSCDTLIQEFLPLEKRTGKNGKLGIFETNDTIEFKDTPKPGWQVTLSQATDESEIKGLFSVTFTLLVGD